MAYVDIGETLLANGDFSFTSSKKAKAYNLLACTFPDMPEIGLDVANMVQSGVDSAAMEAIIIQYLSDFRADPSEYSVTYSNVDGVLHFEIVYHGGTIYEL